MFSQRRNTRMALIQILYADIFVKDSDVYSLIETYQDEFLYSEIDYEYFSFIYWKIHQNYQSLLGIVLNLASKFTIEKMPKIHSIILMIALVEIQFSDELQIDSKIAINEAIELTKIFSDVVGAKFINGILGNFIKNQTNILTNPITDYQFFS